MTRIVLGVLGLVLGAAAFLAASSREQGQGFTEMTLWTGEPYLMVEGTLQNQDGAVSVKAERIESLKAETPEQPSRDFR